jgi:hypothetical protein
VIPNRLAAIKYQAAAAVMGLEIMSVTRPHYESITYLQGNAFSLNFQFKAAVQWPYHLEVVVHVPARRLTVCAYRQLGMGFHPKNCDVQQPEFGRR